MLRCSQHLLRYVNFGTAKQRYPHTSIPVTSVFPLIYSNNLLAKPRRGLHNDYEGNKNFDEDHQRPVLGSKSSAYSKPYKYNEHDKRINPQLITNAADLTPTPEYVGPRTGYLFPSTGWHRMGTNWKEAHNYRYMRKGLTRAEQQEKHVTPRFMRAPRVCPGGPNVRYEGKLEYTVVKFARILMAIHSGMINPNEVITLKTLADAHIVKRKKIIWPGIKVVMGNLSPTLFNPKKGLSFPIHLELQRASKDVIDLIEAGGGTFTATYLSPEMMHQEMFPERYPVFVEPDLPDRGSMDEVSSNPRERGFLAQWVEEDAKYAHPDAGRRLAHYVRPPTPRDSPATVGEYEAVKHHQKWHLNQPGTGTILPWNPMYTVDLSRRSAERLN